MPTKTAAKSKSAKAAPTADRLRSSEETVISFKGFDKNFQCRGFQYAVGQTYEFDGEIVVCQNGAHACEHPLDVFGYYAPALSRFAVVEQSGDLKRHADDTKIASAKITITAELCLSDMIERAVKWVIDRAKPEKGSQATGYRGAASATGDRGAAMASGKYGQAQGADGCALFLVHRDDNWKITHAWAGIVGRDGIKPLTWYTLNSDGMPIEVTA